MKMFSKTVLKGATKKSRKKMVMMSVNAPTIILFGVNFAKKWAGNLADEEEDKREEVRLMELSAPKNIHF